jgi:uncharacterized membrane protein YphA (DoxX/SURF4 family)
LETERKHIIKLVWVNTCRFLLAALFIFSGFVKAVDPLGTTYKIEDYLAAFGEPWSQFSFIALWLSIALSAFELVIGLNLLFKIKIRSSAVLAMIFMLVMTPLTLYIALNNPVTDCGCFGDALIISNEENPPIAGARIIFRLHDDRVKDTYY